MSRISLSALALFALLAVLVITMRTPAAQRLQARAMQFVRPIHTTTSSASSRLDQIGKGLKTLDDLEHEVRNLRVENDKLRATNQMMNDLAEQNNTLRDALDFKKRSNFQLVAARIIARSAATWWSTVQIDRGEKDGLDSDMPVVTDAGLVGKTTTVAANTSYVLLVTDENCKVSAYVEGPSDVPAEAREKGLVSGERINDAGAPALTLNFLPKTAQIQPGEKVFSYGVAGGVFPRGLLLGTIKEVQPRALDIRASMTPAVELARLENVFIVKGMRGAEDSAPVKPAIPVAPAVPASAPARGPAPAPAGRPAQPVAPTPALHR